jgi:hypothetical protein
MNRLRVVMPPACRTEGFSGYTFTGMAEPSEVVWYRHCAERLTESGLMVVQQHSTLASNGAPDKTVIGNCGALYIEFKARLDEGAVIRENQVQAARAMNAKTFYGSGRLCCFLYAMPNVLGIIRGRKSIAEVAKVDALCNPQAFIDAIYCASCPVIKGTTEEEIDEMVDGYALPRASLKHTYKVTLTGRAVTTHYFRTYSPGLAIRATTGLDSVSAWCLRSDVGKLAVEQVD